MKAVIRTFQEIPLLGITAASGSGKTTLLVQLLPILRRAGLTIGAVKHTHHAFEIDKPGKDSYLLRKAGASQMLLGSADRWALMVENDRPGSQEPELFDLLEHLDRSQLDLIIVEGFKMERIPKIEVHRTELEQPLVDANRGDIIAVATNASALDGVDVPLLDINDPNQIANFILQNVVKISPD